MQFEIKGREYFLAFVEQEKSWYLFSPTAQGLQRIPIYVDAVKVERPGMLETENYIPS